MKKIMLQKEDRYLIESIFEWGENEYSVRFNNYEDAIWCHSLSDIYLALYQFKKNGCVKTNDLGYVI